MLPQKVKQKFGAHLSVAGGLYRAFESAIELKCDCFQIFVKNQLQWSAKPLSEGQVQAFQNAQKRTGLGPVVAHAGYLPNLASPDEPARRQSIDAIIDELERCEKLGIGELVVHPGAHLGAGLPHGIRRIAASLDEIHRRFEGRTSILLETTAGQGSTIGHTFSQLAEIIAGVQTPQRLGVCLDTCHLFAAGYHLAGEEGYAATMADLQQTIGWERVRCIHMNDSLQECGSRKDRHAHIGQGRLGRQGFWRIVNDSRLADVPKILETPKEDDGHGRNMDRLNLALLRRMIGRPRPKD